MNLPKLTPNDRAYLKVRARDNQLSRELSAIQVEIERLELSKKHLERRETEIWREMEKQEQLRKTYWDGGDVVIAKLTSGGAA